MKEPARWSVIVDQDEKIWLRIGNDGVGIGIWQNVSNPRSFKPWDELKAKAVLSEGLLMPRQLA